MKLPTMWTDEKHSREEAEPGRNSDVEKVRREKIRDGESKKREDAGVRKGREVAKHCVFPVFCGSGGSKSRLAKTAGAETSGQIFWKMRCGKSARSCGAKHIEVKTSASDDFWMWRCGKSARRCGAKHIWK